MDFNEALSTEANQVQPARRERTNAPSGFEPGIRYESSGVQVITTPPMEQLATEEDWAAAVASLGVSVPAGWHLRLVEARYDPAAWHRDQVGDDAVTRPVWRYRFAVEQDAKSSTDIDALVQAAKRKPSTKAAPAGDTAYLVALGDLQIGKVDGDGVEGTVNRFLEKSEAAVKRLKELRRTRSLGPVYLAHLGDCVEGFVSQGGNNAWRTSLTITEQVRVYRRLLLEQVKMFAAVTDQLVVATVPGNHDDANRPIQTYNNSWATEAAIQVADALELAGNYDHVSVVVAGRDELTVTLDMCGTVVGMAHGHQFPRNDPMKWWSGQAHGRQPIGDADLLLAGHLHHLKILDHAPRTFIQTPALESESTWWKNRTGEQGRPGILSLTVGGGTWNDLQVL